MSNAPALPSPSHALTVNDFLYVIFRQKWKILGCTAVGLIVAGLLYKLQPAPFRSEALLYIRYVMENAAPGLPGNDAKAVSPDQRGETIIASEAEILGSLDIAYDVVDVLGPEKFISQTKGVVSRDRAAVYVRKNLTVDPLPKSSVIRLVFQSRDATLVQPVLTAVVAAYIKKHIEVHRGIELAGDFLSQETDQLHSRLAQTEGQLQKAKEKAGVLSLDDTKKAYTEQAALIQQQIFQAQAELADRSATLQAMTGKSPNAPAASAEPTAPEATLDEYGSIRARLDWLHQVKTQLLSQFTEQNQRVKDISAQIAGTEDRKRVLEEKYPGLLHLGLAAPASELARSDAFDPATQAALLAGLRAKVKVLNSELGQIKSQENNIDQLAGTITELQRQKELEEANYRYYAEHLEAARIDDTLGSGRAYNIAQIQAPTPPHTDPIKEAELLGGIIGGGLALGLAWAFLIEFYLDHSIRRSVEVERDLKIPLFLSIPEFRQFRSNGQSPELFHETLRDRLIGYLEAKGLIHKPKLVAVTGIGRGAGVTTTAAGLARCLSETGEGNVLLVDMTLGQGSAQQFYKGKEVCGLDQILETRGDAQIQDKLFVVGEEPSSDRLSRALPFRFNSLVPKLKASDFDYIIFDLPPVNQISITPRLASFMDIVLLVLESEQSDRDLVRQAVTLLAESRARVGAVLNRTRTYLPYSSHREFLGTR